MTEELLCLKCGKRPAKNGNYCALCRPRSTVKVLRRRFVAKKARRKKAAKKATKKARR